MQWFNIRDVGVSGRSRLTPPYLPCWTEKDTGIEVRSLVQPENTEPMEFTIKSKRLLFDPFQLKPDGRLPEEIKSKLRGKFASSKLTF